MRRCLVALVACLALLASLATPLTSSHAAVVTSAPCDLRGGGTEAPDTKLGAIAAIGCGLFVRATVLTGGTQVATIVGAVACCGFMAVEAFMDNPR